MSWHAFCVNRKITPLENQSILPCKIIVCTLSLSVCPGNTNRKWTNFRILIEMLVVSQFLSSLYFASKITWLYRLYTIRYFDSTNQTAHFTICESQNTLITIFISISFSITFLGSVYLFPKLFLSPFSLFVYFRVCICVCVQERAAFSSIVICVAYEAVGKQRNSIVKIIQFNFEKSQP